MRQTKEFPEEKSSKRFPATTTTPSNSPTPMSSSNGREISQRNALPHSSPGNLAGGVVHLHREKATPTSLNDSEQKKKTAKFCRPCPNPKIISLPALMRQTKELPEEKVAKDFRQHQPPSSSSNGREISKGMPFPILHQGIWQVVGW
ncbi:hypothetical protein CEXT_106771 [Caerostris extrusa]|uniref:Uncharacterized protein n=1 Tax=Caerostris extrusa TaxID=172846 RepID=A0AAV4NPH2_CAEEX|nr:hypothetical protein CEXT_106771 [Caerostris extrusa]